jgi:hypothetical protein
MSHNWPSKGATNGERCENEAGKERRRGGGSAGGAWPLATRRSVRNGRPGERRKVAQVARGHWPLDLCPCLQSHQTRVAPLTWLGY